jgi:hypothetical protein
VIFPHCRREEIRHGFPGVAQRELRQSPTALQPRYLVEQHR